MLLVGYQAIKKNLSKIIENQSSKLECKTKDAIIAALVLLQEELTSFAIESHIGTLLCSIETMPPSKASIECDIQLGILDTKKRKNTPLRPDLNSMSRQIPIFFFQHYAEPKHAGPNPMSLLDLRAPVLRLRPPSTGVLTIQAQVQLGMSGISSHCCRSCLGDRLSGELGSYHSPGSSIRNGVHTDSLARRCLLDAHHRGRDGGCYCLSDGSARG